MNGLQRKKWEAFKEKNRGKTISRFKLLRNLPRYLYDYADPPNTLRVLRHRLYITHKIKVK